MSHASGRFGPDDSVTREQAITLLYQYAKYKGLDVGASADLSGYADAGEISNWALDAVRWAVAAGIVTGRTPVTIAPKGISTRAEVAMLSKNYIDLFPGEDGDL